MHIIWPNIAGNGQVYAQRESDASASAVKSSLKVGEVGTTAQQNILKVFIAKFGFIQDIVYLIFGQFVLFPLELPYFHPQVSECPKQTGPAVSQKFKTISWLYNTRRLTEKRNEGTKLPSV